MTTIVEGKATTGTYVNNAAGQAALNKHTAAKTWTYISSSAGTVRAFVYTNLPADLTEQDVVSASLVLEMAPGTGSRTVTVQRHAKPTVAYTKMVYSNQPGVLAGSTAHTVTQDSADTTWEFDVSADLAAIAAGGAFYGWRITTTYTGTWKMYGWGSIHPPLLVTELDAVPDAPVDLRPDGVTALAAPVFTWRVPNGLISAQLQVDQIGGDFSSPDFDSGVTTSVAQINSAAAGWTGLADGASALVRVRQTTTGGTSEWSDAVTVTRQNQPTVTVTNPGATTEDPSPTVQWATTDQARFQVTAHSGTTTLHDSGVIAGVAAAYQLPQGARVAGQAMTIRVRTWDSENRSPSPGDPGYAEDTQATTYTPGEADPVASLVANQDGMNPWVVLDWTRPDVPDEYLVMRDEEIIARFDGLNDDSDPVTTYTDWTCPPNSDVTYNVVAVIEGAAGDSGPTVPVRTVVTGAWVIDPDTGLFFSITGDSLSLAYADSSVTYVPIGGSRPVKRTFALRGLEGTVGGTLADYDGRTVADQMADLFAIKELATSTFRFVEGDLNIPAVISDLTATPNPEISFARPFPLPRRIIEQVSLSLAQVGELPFNEVAP